MEVDARENRIFVAQCIAWPLAFITAVAYGIWAVPFTYTFFGGVVMGLVGIIVYFEVKNIIILVLDKYRPI